MFGTKKIFLVCFLFLTACASTSDYQTAAEFIYTGTAYASEGEFNLALNEYNKVTRIQVMSIVQIYSYHQYSKMAES